MMENGKSMVTEEDMLRRYYFDLGNRIGYEVKEFSTSFTEVEGMPVMAWATRKAQMDLLGSTNREQLLIDLLGKHEPLRSGYKRKFPWRH